MTTSLTTACEQCGKPAIKTIEMTDSWGSSGPTRTDAVWICASGHKNY